jgi:hypothetical protein
LHQISEECPRSEREHLLHRITITCGATRRSLERDCLNTSFFSIPPPRYRVTIPSYHLIPSPNLLNFTLELLSDIISGILKSPTVHKSLSPPIRTKPLGRNHMNLNQPQPLFICWQRVSLHIECSLWQNFG